MGVIEAVQHSESSRTITSLNGSHSGEKLVRLPMENGECSFRRELPKLKRRRISAVRDFPPGCGRFPQLNNMRSNEDVASIGTSETIPTESLVKIGDLHEVENFMLSNVQVDDSDSIHEKDVGAVEVIESVTALESVVLSDLPKNLHQVNSFRLVEQASSICPVDRLISRDNGDEQKLMLSTGPVDEANLIKVKAVDTVEIIESVTALEHQITKPLKNLHELSNVRPVEEAVLVGTAEHLIIRGNHDNGPGSGELVSSTGQVDETVMMNAKVVGTVETAESITALEHVISDLMKNPHQLGVATTKEEMVTILPPDESISVSKTTVKKYPPRRTVSAVRDFPLLCGRNASMEARSFGQEKLAIGVEPSSSHTANTSMKQTGEDIQDQEFHKSELGGCVSKVIEDKAQPHCKDHAAIQELERRDRCKVYSKMKVVFEDASESFSELSQESNACQGTGDVGHSQEKMGMEMVVFHENKSPSEEHLDISDYRIQLHEEDFESSELKSDRVTVLGLVAASDSSRRNRKGAGKSKPEGGLSETKRKKSDTKRRSKSASRTKVDSDIGGESPKMIIPLAQKSAYEGTEEYSLEHDQKEDLDVIPQSPPPFGPSSSTSRVHDTDATVTRNKVRETLRLFQVLCRKLLQEEEGKSKEEGVSRKRVDYSAAKILKDKGKYVNTGKQILGAVPGVEVGDEFHYRVELTLVGLHRQVQGGIDYVKHDGRILATSIVASGGYADDLDNSSSLIYTGQGGNVMNTNKEPEDQKLERGNLALKNSMLEKNPVRVIRGSESKDGKSKTYVYDGLYLVEKCWQEIGSHHKLVFKFQLDRIRDQPELAWKEVRKSKKLQVREGRCIADISLGKEPIPICAVNTIDDEKPPSFVYITSMIYPDWCRPIPAKGCRCIVECSDSTKCSCAVDNGGEIPYNFNGAIVEAKPIVYECGPSCKCPPSCHNRVSQQGIKFQLEVFKTESRGWGVRSLNSISSGSFICEYIGELLEDKEAEERADGDEYLFDIGNNYNDNSLWDGLSTLMPDAQPSPFEVVGDGGFTIDAAQYGNVGRFINHSCSPNLYAQNVLFDHDDTRIPHIMLFAAENIPPLQELTYHYNYMIDQVRDSNGNIKRKNCYCGSPDCTGRLY